MSRSLKRLASVTRGESVVIEVVGAAGAHGLRLRELGFARGRRVHVLDTDDPMLCVVDQARVGLARELAEGILVQ